MTVLITLTSAGTDTGPFSLYSDIDGYNAPFEINVSKASLLAGYTSVVVPNSTVIIRIKSEGSCVNFVDVVVPAYTTTTTTTTAAPTTTTTSTAAPAPILTCYDITETEIPGATVTCGSTQKTNMSSVIRLDLKDENGNPFVATQNVFFTIRFYGQTCDYSRVITDEGVSVPIGQTFVEYTSQKYTWSSCGPDGCANLFKVFIGEVYPSFPDPNLPKCTSVIRLDSGGTTTTAGNIAGPDCDPLTYPKTTVNMFTPGNYFSKISPAVPLTDIEYVQVINVSRTPGLTSKYNNVIVNDGLIMTPSTLLAWTAPSLTERATFTCEELTETWICKVKIVGQAALTNAAPFFFRWKTSDCPNCDGSTTTTTTTTAPTTTTTSTASTTTTTTTVSPALFCFEVQDILLNNIPVTCLGLPQTNVSKKLVVSLKDINGNPVLATEDMAFIADFSEQSCYDPIISTQQTITVLAGTSSAEYGYLEINWSDCGQGDCIGNFIVYEGTTTPPAAYSTLPNCSVSTTTTTTTLQFNANLTLSPSASAACSLTLNTIIYTQGISIYSDPTFTNPIDTGSSWILFGENAIRTSPLGEVTSSTPCTPP
jgi:hypothetical protein